MEILMICYNLEYFGFLDINLDKLSCISVCLIFVDKNDTIKQFQIIADAGRPNLPFWRTFVMFYTPFYSFITKIV